MSYNPIDDEKKPFTLREFEAELKDAVKQYADDFDGPGTSEFMQTSHFFDEWMSSFKRYMSW